MAPMLVVEFHQGTPCRRQKALWYSETAVRKKTKFCTNSLEFAGTAFSCTCGSPAAPNLRRWSNDLTLPRFKSYKRLAFKPHQKQLAGNPRHPTARDVCIICLGKCCFMRVARLVLHYATCTIVPQRSLATVCRVENNANVRVLYERDC